MAPRTLSIKITLRVTESEADGSKCIMCGDLIFLRAYVIDIVCNGKRIGRVRGMLCGSCGECVKEKKQNKGDQDHE